LKSLKFIETQTQDALISYFKAYERLKKLGVILNQKDFTSQIGEWLVEVLYEGKRAKSGIQRDFDVETENDFIQVKTHAKASTTKARYSRLKMDIDSLATRVVIVVFTQEYKIMEIYDVPKKDCLCLLRNEKDGSILYWNDLKEYEVTLNQLNEIFVLKALIK
jgi:hypothetical protein